MNTVDIKGQNNGNKLAYPVSETQHTGFSATHDKIYTTVVDGGLTKREMFAMAAMQGLCGNSTPGSHHIPENLAKEAVQYADELLKQLEL